MNRKLLDPFKSVALPEVIEEYLDYGVAKCCAFNRRGTLLATGTEDGYIIIWDFETRGVAKVLAGHSTPAQTDGAQAPLTAVAATVTSLAWARNGRHLLSGSLDKRIILWDVLEGTSVCEVTLLSGVTRVSLTARQPYKAVASLISTSPVLVDLNSRELVQIPSIDFKAGSEKGQQDLVVNSAPGVAVLSSSGKEVLLGQLRGIITIYDMASQKILDVVKLPAVVKVISLSLNRQGTLLLVNCSDKVGRLYEVKPRPLGLQPLSIDQLKAALQCVEAGRVGSLLHQPDSGCMLQLAPLSFQNAVEKNAWRNLVTSGDSEHVVGAVASKDDHRVYLWSRLYGKLDKILEGPRNESTTDLAWHPCRSMLVTLSSNGKVYIWSQIYNENWSAFAPDFQEMDENQEYVEQEDEFDLNERAASTKEADQEAAEELDVDILTKEVLQVFSSDDEDEEGSEGPLYWLPAEVANVEQADGQLQQDGKQAVQTEQEDSSEKESDEDDEEQRADELILDRPRDRKRRVRFENDYSELSDEDLMQAPPAAAPAGSNRGRGRGSGRRGRPPKYGGAGATAGRGSSGYVSMAGLPVGPAGEGQQSGAGMLPISGYMYSGPGNVFNPSNTTYQQQQQHWP